MGRIGCDISIMYRFFCEEAGFLEDEIIIENPDYHHIRHVLRIKEGEMIQVVCGKNVYNSVITSFHDEYLVAQLMSEDTKSYESPLHIHLYQAMLKSDKIEWVIQKCVELGVSEFTLLDTDRVIVKYDKRKIEKKMNRYQNIVEASSKQSKRTSFMKIHPPASLKDLKAIEGIGIVCYERETISIKKELIDASHICLFIGPEGGFSEDEIQYLRGIGVRPVSLGNRILRAETAAISACTILQYELGDMHG